MTISNVSIFLHSMTTYFDVMEDLDDRGKSMTDNVVKKQILFVICSYETA